MNNNKTSTLARLLHPWSICIIGMLFYCYNYFLRVSPSVMQTDLTQAFHINATQFGILAGLYYWGYTPMQIPAGMIFDKFGTRFVLFIACLTAMLGLAIFIAADQYVSAGAGRLLIGLGTAFSYIGVLKLASMWLPPNRFATVAGLTTAVGMSCAAFAKKYLTAVSAVSGYKTALHSVLLLGIVLSIAILFFVRSQPKQTAHTSRNQMQTPMNMGQLLHALRIILTNKQMWLIGAIGCLLYLPASVFLDVWDESYLQSVYQLTAEQAVNVSTFTFAGWIIAGPLIGMLSDKLKRRRMPLVISGGIAAILLCVVFYVRGLNLHELYVIFFAIGFCCGSHPLCFALGKENNPAKVSGTSVAFTNSLIMAGGMIFQPLAGKLLDLHTTSPLGADGLAVYSASDYTFALSIIPLGVALGIILSFFLKETYCESQAEEDREIDLALKPA